jgi:hypothetical protein
MFLNFFTFKFVTSEETLGLEFLLAYLAGDALDDHLLAGGSVGRLHVLLQVALPVEWSAAQIAPASTQPTIESDIRIQHFRLNTDLDPDTIRIQGFDDQKLKKYS